VTCPSLVLITRARSPVLRGATLAFLLSVPTSATAAPSLAWIFPAGGQRGTHVTLTVAGDNLAQVKGFFTTGSGLQAELLPPGEPLRPPLVGPKPGEKPTAPDAKRYRQFRIAIAPDAPLGRHEVRVFDETGASNPRYFHIGDQPETVEQEPNDESVGQLVESPVVVNGRIQAQTDQDIYTFRGRKGQRLIGEVYGLRSLGMIGDSWLKGYMELRDAAGKVLAANEGYYRWDPMIDVTLPADGEYSFLFRELTYRGAEAAVYRLAIGSLPRATALFPAGGRRGEAVPVTFIGANLGEDSSRVVSIPADAEPGPRDERLQTPSGWTNALPFDVGDLPELREAEPNDARSRAMIVTPPVTINGRMERPGDVDSYRFKVAKGQRLVLEALANRAENPMDPFLRLWDADENLAQEDDDGRERDARIERTFDSDGEYVVQVRDLDERGGESFVYRLRIAPPRPDFTLVATPDRPLLPAGGTAVLNLAVQRSDGFAGDVAVSLTGLPPGLTAASTVIPKGQERARLTVTAAEELLVQALMLRVIGRAEVAGRQEQRLAETSETYNIQGTAFTRMLLGPIATVGPPAPVALSVEPSTLSIKGGETVSLRVRVKRRSEGTGEILVKVPDLPAGVTAEPVRIVPGATEAELALKADRDATAAQVGLVATSETKVGEAAITAWSPLFTLKVQEASGYVLSIEPKTITVPRDSKTETNLTVKVVRRGGFDGPIDLEWQFAASGPALPAGQIEAGKNEAKVALKSPPGLSEGAVEVRLLGKAMVSGAAYSREVELKLTVAPPRGEGK
jgi:hypothetical protein